MATTMIVPKFANESEEADWWYENRHLLEEQFLKASADGRLKRVSVQQRLEEHNAKLEAAATLELQGEDAHKAHLAAKKRGMAVEPYLRMLIHEALEKETAA